MNLDPQSTRLSEVARFVGDKLFLPDDVTVASRRKLYLAEMPDYDAYLRAKSKTEERRIKDDPPVFLLPCYVEPLLSRRQEEHLFRKYNILKYLAKQTAKQRRLSLAEERVAQAKHIRTHLIYANYRLIVNHVRKRYPVEALQELCSEGFMALHRAIDCFDWRLGNKFSTYCTWAIANNLMRHSGKSYEQLSKFIPAGEYIDTIADVTVGRDMGYDEELTQFRREELVRDLLPHAGTNGSRERLMNVLVHRFGLFGEDEETLELVGSRFGVSKERIRQLQNKALRNIQDYAESEGIQIEEYV